MEISIGEYIRTEQGYIGKVKNNWVIDGKCKLENDKYILRKNIVKHSKNIINLIEEGDYVNGYYCKRIPNFLNKMCNFDLNTMEWTPLENIDIWYNILTKEQYNANCYVVKE